MIATPAWEPFAGRPMSQPPLDLRSLFVGRLTGQGEVRGFTGKILRTFTVEYLGEWSIGYDALHLDERVDYADGRMVERHWAIQFDAEGQMVGYDSQQAARLRSRRADGRVRLIFDRPSGLTREISAPRVELDVFEEPDRSVRLIGRVGLLGLTVQRTRVVLSRV